MGTSVFVTGIWKQCNLAYVGSAERANVCLMWDCPGRVIGLFTRERQSGRCGKNNIVRRWELWVLSWAPSADVFPSLCLPV